VTEEKKLKPGCVIDRKRAEEIVDEFLYYYMVDFDDFDPRDDDDKETLSGLKSARRVLVKGVERGMLDFKVEPDKKGVDRMITYQYLTHDKDHPIQYNEFNAMALVQMKNVHEKDNVGKIHAVMASLSGRTRDFIGGLYNFDEKIMRNLGTIFLAQ
jgi:hypothetical protein